MRPGGRHRIPQTQGKRPFAPGYGTQPVRRFAAARAVRRPAGRTASEPPKPRTRDARPSAARGMRRRRDFSGKNTYDLNRNDPEAKRAAQRKRGPLTAAKWALRATGWLENIVIALVLAWLVFIVGAVLTGTVVVFGKPL